ncbi:MAG: hypothetical protein RLZ98_3433 [Pseudomonadota bacterium]|jgi:polyhydroxyalkanoate synthesis repressor PhaR
MLNKPEAAGKSEVVVIKKYANRRLYNTETSTYVTLEDLAAMVRANRDFVVFDAKTGDELTHAVLTQIIVEQEGRAGQTLLPVPFLRQLIRFYDDALGKLVPGYLQFSLEALAKENEKFRSRMASSFGNPGLAFEVYQEQTRKNLEIFEQAMAMWASFAPGQPGARGKPTAQPQSEAGKPEDTAKQVVPGTSVAESQEKADLEALKAELARMAEKIEQLSKEK